MTNPIIQYSVLNSWFLSVSVTMYHTRIALKKAKLIAILRSLYLQCQGYEQRVSSKHWNLSGTRIHGCTISLRFLGIILRVLRLEVSVYNVYITNLFQTSSRVKNGGRFPPDFLYMSISFLHGVFFLIRFFSGPVILSITLFQNLAEDPCLLRKSSLAPCLPLIRDSSAYCPLALYCLAPCLPGIFCSVYCSMLSSYA
jgi:hypothetical protein